MRARSAGRERGVPIRVTAPWGQLAGWAVIALVNTLAIAVLVPWPAQGWSVRILHHGYDIGHLLALGFATAAVVAIWLRRGPRHRVWTYLAQFATAAVLCFVILEEDLAGLARMLGDERGSDWLLYLLLVAAAAAIPLCVRIGRGLARPGLRWLAVAAAIAGAGLNSFVFPNSYDGLHFWLGWLSATLAGAALSGAELSPGVRVLTGRPRLVRVLAGTICAFSVTTILWWPRNAVVIELHRMPGSVLAPFLSRWHFEDEPGVPVLTRADWYRDRGLAPDIPATEPVLHGGDLIVILVTIDAMRADVMDHELWGRNMPTIQKLRQNDIEFSTARSTGSQTVDTLATLFSGKHFSQQRWTRHNRKKRTAELWPWEDDTPRFPEILQEHGVVTATYASAWWLVGRMGIVRGFDVERRIRSATKTDYGFPLAADLMEPALELIRDHRDGPLFLFLHFMEPHAPYTRGGTIGSRVGDYSKEIGMVDKELLRLLELLDRTGQWSRTVLIVGADHGEAFGEHNSTYHATTLYEEVLRVPLIIRVPGARPRVVAEPVSTVDLGPTILDLFGLATPAHFMGQSLVPFLRGEDVALSRPIVAEGRLKQALITPEGFKAIRDLRNGTIEVYDLDEDPHELLNIADREEAADALNRLRRFFEVHTYRKDGYQVPFRK